MTPELNLDCLEVIFGFLTPVEWIDLSDVCHLWRLAVSRMWSQSGSKITFESLEKEFFGHAGIAINTRKIRKIALRLSPFMKSLSVRFTASRYPDLYLSFGKNQKFVYLLQDGQVNHEREFHLLIQNATELSEVEFKTNYPPKESLDVIFSQNEIKKLSVKNVDLGTVYENCTDGVEELHLTIDKGSERYESFEKHFPNLHKVVYNTWVYADPRSNSGKLDLSQILSCVNRNLKQFFIHIRGDEARIDLTSGKLKRFYQLSQLEELHFNFYRYPTVKNVDKFLKKLVDCLPQLRSLKLRHVVLNNSAVSSLMSFQQLESMLVQPDGEKFNETELPEMKNLTECEVILDVLHTTNKSYREGIVKMISKMPKLQRLIFDENCYFKVEDAELTIEIVYQVIVLATSKDKKVVITVDWTDEKFRIEKKRTDEYQGFPYEEPETLSVDLRSRTGSNILEHIFDKEIKRCVEQNMMNHHVLVL